MHCKEVKKPLDELSESLNLALKIRWSTQEGAGEGGE